MPLVPPGARLLDVGCGAGLFLGLLADEGLIATGRGFDSSVQAVALAQSMLSNLQASNGVLIERRESSAGWPDEQFDAVSMIDVLHHIPVRARQGIIATVASRLKPRGVFIYKDMVTRPRWRAWCNQAHDLVVARQWITHQDIAMVDSWAKKESLRMIVSGARNQLWYGHEWRVYQKQPSALSA
ncbi:MAG TPA: class I SAM-dependent methyltransferase [Stellaceae bacterium]|nr:class I SAM-dependent methyltransferase [Stellaceae bacterium]